MNTNPLRNIHAHGQSIWLDYISRDLLDSGKLRRLIFEDGVRGITSNPAIFEQSIDGSDDYDDDIRAMALMGKDAMAIYESLSQRDVQRAADEFRHLYDSTDAADGYVSLEVNPHLAHDTRGTIEEARRLWTTLNRPNVLIKVPATTEGLPAIRQLTNEGINVNVTLLFGLSRYREVAQAYIAGLEERAARGDALRHVASVASFFVSRIDQLVDPLLESRVAQGDELAGLAKGMRGQVAIASAKSAYRIYTEIFGGDRFAYLAQRSGRAQRLLWASTGTKNPAYEDIKYVEALIGAHTVNTIPVDVLDAYRDHGDPKARIDDGVDEACRVMAQLPELGIGIDAVTQQLEREGVEKFAAPFDKLLATMLNRAHSTHRHPGIGA